MFCNAPYATYNNISIYNHIFNLKDIDKDIDIDKYIYKINISSFCF